MLHIISKSKVQLPTDDHPPPGSIIQLSFFDARFVEFPVVKTVLLYPNATALPSSFDSFKSSLALTLPHFHPLGGDLTYLPSSNDVAIICSKDSGVVVIEAKSDIDICPIIEDCTPDKELLLKFVPNNNNLELPLPVLSVQFTSFTGGGVAVGIAWHHAAVDGWGRAQFTNFWAITCRDGSVPPGLVSVHDRSIILYPSKEEMKKEMLKIYAPNIPKISLNAYNSIEGHVDQSTLRIFTVDQLSVQHLKERAIPEPTALISARPTTFQVLAANFWIAVARSKGLKGDNMTPTILITPLDCRTLLEPPISTAYTGNCVRSIIVESNGTSLMAPDGFSNTCASIAKAISKAKERPLSGTNMNEQSYDIKSFKGLKVLLSGSPRLRAYDADFGWGKPSLYTIVTKIRDGYGILHAGREEGTIQIQVMLNGGMEEFARAFEGGFGR